MQTFTGIEYLEIDIANNFGLDKEIWGNRILWTRFNESRLEELVHEADEPLLMAKAVLALREVQKGNPVGHNMSLDATASGLQILACLTGCKETARKVNLIDTGEREDVYTYVVSGMNKLLDEKEHVTRNTTKTPLMTHFYCKAEHEEFNDNQHGAFYRVIETGFKGAELAKKLIRKQWNSDALSHKCTMPDGEVGVATVKEMIKTSIEVDELDHSTFTYQFEANQCSSKDTSLVAHVIHMVDAYIAREMCRRAKKRGFELVHVHDSFWASPQYMNIVRRNYIDILAEIADSDLLSSIISDLCGEEVEVSKLSDDLGDMIRESNYALS